MNQDVAAAIEELRKAFAPSEITISEDGQGGAYVIVEAIDIGDRFLPSVSWLGGHIPALYPAADIYPLFMDASVKRVDGIEFQVPITQGHSFQGRTAIQISRRNNQVHLAPQSAVAKFAKVLHFLRALP